MCIGKAADNGTKGYDRNDGPAARSLYFTSPVLLFLLVVAQGLYCWNPLSVLGWSAEGGRARVDGSL